MRKRKKLTYHHHTCYFAKMTNLRLLTKILLDITHLYVHFVYLHGTCIRKLTDSHTLAYLCIRF